MFTEDKVTEIFCMADDFCKFFDAMMKKYTIKEARKRNYHRDGTLSKAEVMVIMILFHNSGYRCLKHFYLEHVCKRLRHLFPEVVSYNRFVELEKEVAIPLPCSSKRCCLANAQASALWTARRSGCAGISVFIFIRLSKALPGEGSARWDGSSDSSCTSSATRKGSCSAS